MKICNKCDREISEENWECIDCGYKPELFENIKAFAPELALKNNYFQSDQFKIYADAEYTNFWLKSRKNLVLDLIKKYFKNSESLFEIGLGTGFILSEIEEKFPKMKTIGSDIYAESINYSSKRLQRTKLVQLDACKIPFKEEFDIIGSFDVLEHIEKDEQVLLQMNKALKPKGGIIIIVPQHMFLWSKTDEYTGHVRRYEYKDFKEKLEKTGFKIIKKTSFISTLLPFMFLARTIKKFDKSNQDIGDELKIHPLLNFLFEKILNFERFLINIGFNLPFGGSLVVVARKEVV